METLNKIKDKLDGFKSNLIILNSIKDLVPSEYIPYIMKGDITFTLEKTTPGEITVILSNNVYKSFTKEQSGRES